MPPLNWAAAEDAIRNWVKTGSGLTDPFVYFANQQGKQPSGGPFIVIRLEGASPLGAYDGVEFLTDLTRAAGSEIELRTYAPREFVVTLTAFAGSVVTATGKETSKDLLNRVRNAIGRESVIASLNAASLACYDIGDVVNISGLLEMKFESRATLEARFYTSDSDSEFTGYVTTAPPVGTLST